MLVACAQTESGIPMEFSKACVAENDKKVVEMNGFLSAGVSVYCSNRAGRMECGFNLHETPGTGRGIGADIEQGSGANSVEKLKSSYRREDIKIRDSAGNVINLADKVKVTGKLSVSPDAKACFIQVRTIQR